jgi:hypothetical protein
MVDSINGGGPVSTLLRAQQQAPLINAVHNSQHATQKLIQQVANGAKPTTVSPSAKIVSPNENLPRGSLVDILA